MSDDTITHPEFPSNSRRSKRMSEIKREEPEQNPRKMEKVVTGQIVMKKKSLLERAGEKLFGPDGSGIGNYIVWEVLVPSAKKMIYEMVVGGMEIRLYGERKSKYLKHESGRSVVEYSSLFNKERRDDRRPERREEPVTRVRGNYELDLITIDNHAEADMVLDMLLEAIDKYGDVTVAEFYGALGLKTEYPDRKYGWDNLERASVERARGGWVIDLPEPKLLDT